MNNFREDLKNSQVTHNYVLRKPYLRFKPVKNAINMENLDIVPGTVKK